MINQFSMKKRKSIVLFPRLYLDPNFKFTFDDYELIKVDALSDIDKYLNEKLKRNGGCILKYKGEIYFDIDDSFQRSVFCFVESLRFSYFSNNITGGLNPLAQYISNETFNPYFIIEKNPDPSYESKIKLFNGFESFLESRDDFIFSNIYLIKGIKLIDIFFRNFNSDFYRSKLDEIYLYNQVLKTQSNYDFSMKSLFARASIEVAISNNSKLNKKNYIDLFFNNIEEYIIKSDLENVFPEINNLYKSKIQSHLFFLKEKFTNCITQITDARHKIVHEGKEDSEHENIIVYLIWFELFLELLSENEPKLEYSVRLVFFLWLLCFKLNSWNKFDFEKPNKKNVLQIYSDNYRLYKHYKERNNLEAYIKGMEIELDTNSNSIYCNKTES
ncbi:hypothetical protein [Acinetobacter bereziniae]|uniref:hypothetical protein n=1 Tax=Acinetobacter bereziniae TaxID=106648 RepID=UPI00124FA441|nr:hypothetical protein [Acinetobacter bereziniae]